MLRELRIGNLALAEDVVVRLDDGLTMITGETGAGKSLIAGALSLLAGGKADRRLIRRGEELAFVEGVFDLADMPVAGAACRGAGVRLREDGILVLRRELRREGRGRVLINGLISSQALLEELGGRLVAVQSQDQQRLLAKSSYARDFLDTVLGLDTELAANAEALEAYKAAASELKHRQREAEFAQQQMDMWRYQHRELTDAALDVGEQARLREISAVGRNARALAEAAGRARENLSEGDVSARSLLGSVEGALTPLAGTGERVDAVLELVQEAAAAVGEATSLLAGFLDGMELDPERLDEMEARLALYQDLQRKYGGSLEDLIRMVDELGERIARQEDATAEIAALEVRRDTALRDLETAARVLHERRRAGARDVAARATDMIRPLALPDLELDIEIVATAETDGPVKIDGRSCRVAAHGASTVVLRARTNAGEPVDDVARIASGGEKSRIFLGLSVLADSGDMRPLLLFDEIDAGLGMDNAVPVADLLATLARDRQVLCITHLATVAVKGARHLAVSKSQVDGRTSVALRQVDGAERIEEVVRLLGGNGPGSGGGLSEVAYAKQLLAEA